MSTSKQHPFCSYEITEKDNGNIFILFKGRIDVETSGFLLKSLSPIVQSGASVTADLENITYFDDFGALLLFELKQLVNGNFRIININEKAKAILSQVNFDALEKCVPIKKRRSVNMILRIGETTITEVSSIKFMIAFIGSLILSLLHVFLHPKSLRMDDTITHMEKTGADALPIVALISFLLGLIMAFMSSMQFRQFGAGIYVASLVAFAMVSELVRL